MAKGQKRSNREAKKPKKVKAPAAAAPAGFMPRGQLDPVGSKKKR